MHKTLFAILLSLAAAVGVTTVLTLRITPPLRRAVATAQAIAAGCLDPPAVPAGSGEMARLLHALSQLCVDLATLRATEIAARRNDHEITAARAASEARTVLADEYEATVEAAAAGVIRITQEQSALMDHLGVEAAKGSRAWSAIAEATSGATREAHAVAAAAATLSGTIAEIDIQVASSARMADEAANMVRSTDATVQQLAASASRIGTVVDMIQGIAARTNLLALNAAIEASRAGQAGKGFAVVANEVKALASQTAQATAEIGRQIGEARTAASQAVSAIRDIGKGVGHLAEVGGEIAAAVSRQGISTHEIVASIGRVAAEAERVERGLDILKCGNVEMNSILLSVDSVTREVAQQGMLIQDKSTYFLKSLRVA